MLCLPPPAFLDRREQTALTSRYLQTCGDIIVHHYKPFCKKEELLYTEHKCGKNSGVVPLRFVRHNMCCCVNMRCSPRVRIQADVTEHPKRPEHKKQSYKGQYKNDGHSPKHSTGFPAESKTTLYHSIDTRKHRVAYKLENVQSQVQM